MTIHTYVQDRRNQIQPERVLSYFVPCICMYLVSNNLDWGKRGATGSCLEVGVSLRRRHLSSNNKQQQQKASVHRFDGDDTLLEVYYRSAGKSDARKRRSTWQATFEGTRAPHSFGSCALFPKVAYANLLTVYQYLSNHIIVSPSNLLIIY